MIFQVSRVNYLNYHVPQWRLRSGSPPKSGELWPRRVALPCASGGGEAARPRGTHAALLSLPKAAKKQAASNLLRRSLQVLAVAVAAQH